MIRQYKISSTPTLARSGLREMEDKDVKAVFDLFTRYMQRFDMVPVMTEDEIRHQLLSGIGKGEKDAAGRREGQVVWSYVVEVSLPLPVAIFSTPSYLHLWGHQQNLETHQITDFFSFYSLPSTVIGHTKHNLLEAAYLFYYATDAAFQTDLDENSTVLKRRLNDLIGDAIIVANEAKFDVFNALTLMDNNNFLQDLKVGLSPKFCLCMCVLRCSLRAVLLSQFGSGDGLLNFYLYNWRTKPLAGHTATADRSIGRGVGVVML